MLPPLTQWYRRSEHGAGDPGGVGGPPAMLHLTLLLLCPHGRRAVASAVRRGEPAGGGGGMSARARAAVAPAPACPACSGACSDAREAPPSRAPPAAPAVAGDRKGSGGWTGSGRAARVMDANMTRPAAVRRVATIMYPGCLSTNRVSHASDEVSEAWCRGSWSGSPADMGTYSSVEPGAGGRVLVVWGDTIGVDIHDGHCLARVRVNREHRQRAAYGVGQEEDVRHRASRGLPLCPGHTQVPQPQLPPPEGAGSEATQERSAAPRF